MFRIKGLDEATAISTSRKSNGNGGKGGFVKAFVNDEIRLAVALTKVGEFMQIPYLIGTMVEEKQVVLIPKKSETEGDHYVARNKVTDKDVEFAHSTFWHNIRQMLLATGFDKQSKKNYLRVKPDISGIKVAIEKGLIKANEIVSEGILTKDEAKKANII